MMTAHHAGADQAYAQWSVHGRAVPVMGRKSARTRSIVNNIALSPSEFRFLTLDNQILTIIQRAP
jgi:hypothetical protein